MMHSGHLTIHGYLGVGTHSALIPPSVVPAILPHIAMDTLLGLKFKEKYSKTVIGPFGFQFIGKGNDSGGVVPHLCIPPLSVLVPVVIAFGSSKPMFSASTVLIDVDGSGIPMAAALLGQFSVNQACNDPCNYPSDLVIAPNSVVVGLTWGDILCGFINIAIDVAISALANKFGGWLAGALVSRIGGRIISAFLSDFTEMQTKIFGQEMAKSMTRDAVENILERHTIQIAQEVLGKIIEGMVGDAYTSVQEARGVPDGDVGNQLGTYVDQQSHNSSPEISSDLTNNSSGAAPIYDAY